MHFKNQLITTIEQLKGYLNLSDEEVDKLKLVSEKYPFCTTKYYVSLINNEDPNDPLRKLQIPTPFEENRFGENDTSGELQNTKLPGLQHKYAKTALLLSTNKCAMFCRHCFRKRLVGVNTGEVLRQLESAIEYIKNHEEINNVLISGGDSFYLPTSLIKKYLEELSKIKHISFIRFGTRMPVVLPSRIYEDKELLNILENYSKIKQIYIVTQFNHYREITEESIKSIEALKAKGVIINNQAVLLKGINASPDVLSKLMQKLVSVGVNPYYVFQCRPVKGVKNHFQVPFIEGIQIVEDAKKELSGHAKRFKYVLSHKTGKIEILGKLNSKILFKYHQSPIKENMGRVFEIEADKNLAWLEDEIKLST